MNILIISSGGKPGGNPGLIAMRDSARTVWGAAHITCLTTEEDRPWLGAILGRDARSIEADDLETEDGAHYVPEASTADLVDLAFMQSDLFLTRAQANWDVVLLGVDKGPVTSVPDTIRHAAVGAGLYANVAYGAACFVATHQGHRLPPHAWDSLKATMRNHYPGTGETFILNIPTNQPKKFEYAPLSHYSTLILPPTSLVPRAREERSATTLLAQDCLTLSKTTLRLNPELRY